MHKDPQVPATAAETESASRSGDRLGDLLVDAGLARRAAVEQAAADAHDRGIRIGEALINSAAAEERDVYAALARQYGLELSRQEELMVIAEPSLMRSIPVKYLERHRVIPIVRLGRRLIVATDDVGASTPELGKVFDADDIDYHLVTPTDYRRLRLSLDFDDQLLAQAPSRVATRTEDLLVSSPELDPALIGLLNRMLLEAIARRASDLHLERYGDRVRFRLRMDGDLHDIEHFHISPEQYLGLINVIKIKSLLDIAEHRIPQGGRFSTVAGGRTFDLRVQTQPAFHGEHVVIRLLSKDIEMLYIEQLGLPPALAKTYRRLLESPSGLILVVGPTGSGKSTTLYAGLHILARDTTRKVITVEDPIEYAIDNVQQTQVRPELGFSFAHAMRAFVREDPDVIMVGEIRDGETALEALRASQTGHVVLSTLHCSDTVDAVQRLFDLGTHPNSVAGELLAVFAQRLAKRICTHCREECEPAKAILAEVFPDAVPDDFRTFRGKGCPHCLGYGTHGRIGVIEYLPASSRLRNAISRRLPVDELRALAYDTGLVPMRDHALALVQDGVISLEELPMIFSTEQLRPRAEVR
jgi:type IV pilus assembly protein PilB